MEMEGTHLCVVAHANFRLMAPYKSPRARPSCSLSIKLVVAHGTVLAEREMELLRM